MFRSAHYSFASLLAVSLATAGILSARAAEEPWEELANGVLGQPANFVLVAEVPDRVDDRAAVVGTRVGAGEIAARVLGDHDEGLTRGAGLRAGPGPLPCENNCRFD